MTATPAPPQPDRDWNGIGILTGAFGVRGEVKVKPLTETPGAVLEFPVWWLTSGSGDPRPHTLVRGRCHGQGVVASLQGVETREQAAALTGARAAVPRDALPKLQDETYYWVDLIGCRVVDETDTDLGRVAEMMATGSSDVMVIQGGPEGERLLPFNAEIVLAVDLERRIVTVRPLPGM